jgi:hypothetical protein
VFPYVVTLITVSCGIMNQGWESAESLSGRADAAMYEAKRQEKSRGDRRASGIENILEVAEAPRTVQSLISLY